MNARTGVMLVLVLLLGACTQRQQPETFGDALEQRGQASKAVADRWQAANAKVQRGTRMVEDARRSEAEGERLIREGRTEMREAEEQARLLRRQPLPAEGTPPAEPEPPPPVPAPVPAPQY